MVAGGQALIGHLRLTIALSYRPEWLPSSTLVVHLRMAVFNNRCFIALSYSLNWPLEANYLPSTCLPGTDTHNTQLVTKLQALGCLKHRTGN
jgi:hypothetical protein